MKEQGSYSASQNVLSLSIWKWFKDISYQNSLVQDDNGRSCKEDPKNAFSTLKDEGKTFLLWKKCCIYLKGHYTFVQKGISYTSKDGHVRLLVRQKGGCHSLWPWVPMLKYLNNKSFLPGWWLEACFESARWRVRLVFWQEYTFFFFLRKLLCLLSMKKVHVNFFLLLIWSPTLSIILWLSSEWRGRNYLQWTFAKGRWNVTWQCHVRNY